LWLGKSPHLWRFTLSAHSHTAGRRNQLSTYKVRVTHQSRTWACGERGALTCRRSQDRVPAVAVNQLLVLACCWWSFPLQDVAVRERPLWLTDCCYPYNTLFSHSA
jgi:hypothetical protein